LSRLLSTLVTGALAIGAVALCGLLVGLPDAGGELAARVAARMPESGVTHPVSAVLLDFRGYDTFLELLVLLLAVLGARSTEPLSSPAPVSDPSPVLEQLLRLLVPLLVVVAAYLFWLGSRAPGGAFQAGAVLGAAGVLMLLAERRLQTALPPVAIRLLLGAGVGAFAAVGGALALTGAGMLTFPPEHAGSLIYTIEALATLAIATTLVALFARTTTAEG
jgi:multisubunit Na+/H+ antiporter MnhB subunit